MGVQAIVERNEPAPETDPVTRARRGDFSAYEEIYRAHVGRIHSLCLRMTADRPRAEELTQEAFVRAWERLASFRGGEFGAWLHRVAVNVVLGQARSARRRRWKENEMDEIVELTHAAPGSDPGVELDLEQAIARLPERVRAVFVLHDVEGYRHEEIGRLLGVATGTSKTHLHRARRLLREALTR